MAKDNDAYGIADRKLVSQVSKAVPLNGEALQRITDPYIRVSLLLQREFGLRREEAIKFIPAYADRGDRIVLKATWTKGARSANCRCAPKASVRPCSTPIGWPGGDR